MNKFSKVIVTAVQEGCSDVHITGGHPVVYRKNGQIHFDSSGRWTHGEIDGIVKKILTVRQLQTLRNRWSVDMAMTIRNIRIRVNVFNTTRGLSIAIRLLPGTVPTLEKLNLHPSLKQIAELRAGLVLICGATGSGKSTTIAALVDEINRNRAAHIVTLEDPVEYRYVSRKSFIEQRELGAHMPSFEQGLVDVLREDPDVVVVGELRDPEVMRLTLNAAESGHLVIATLHATHSEDALYRLCNSFPLEAQEEIRHQVASTLQWLVVQHLVIKDDIGFRVPVLSILRVLVPLLLALVDALHEIVVGLGVEVLEGEVLQLHPDPVDPETVGQGGIELEGLQGDGAAPRLGLELEGAHVVHPVGQLHQDDPDVGRHGEDHLAEVLGLPLLPAREGDLGELRQPVDENGHVLAEPLLDLLERREGVLDGVVQDARDDRRRVELHVGQDVGHLHGVREVGLAGKAHLSGMDRGREDVGLLDELQVRLRGIFADLIEDVRYSDHSVPSAHP